MKRKKVLRGYIDSIRWNKGATLLTRKNKRVLWFTFYPQTMQNQQRMLTWPAES